MNNEIIIKDVSIDFSDYYTKDNISYDAQSKVERVDILAVPTKYSDEEFYFAQETIDFIKYCRLNSSEHTFDVLAEGDIKIRSLHSFDIWMPVIWLASNVLLPFAINMVSNYIWEK